MEDLRAAWRTLGLDHRATRQDVTRAYRHAVKRHHPDAGGDASAFGRVEAAYRRALGAARQDPAQARPPRQHEVYRSAAALTDARPQQGAAPTRQRRVRAKRQPSFAAVLDRQLKRHGLTRQPTASSRL